MAQQSNRDADGPNRAANREPAEGSRQMPDRSSDFGIQDKTASQGGGISNRPLDREENEQSQLPPRGQSKSEE